MDMSRSMEHRLEVGARCWLFSDGGVHIVEITKRNDIFEDWEATYPSKWWFSMYCVKDGGGHDRDSLHRDNLYVCPAERERLLDALRQAARHCTYLHDELKAQESTHVPEMDDEV